MPAQDDWIGRDETLSNGGWKDGGVVAWSVGAGRTGRPEIRDDFPDESRFPEPAKLIDFG